MDFARRNLLQAALAGTATFVFGAPAFAQSAAQPFPQWVESFRAKATAKGISLITLLRGLGVKTPPWMQGKVLMDVFEKP